MPTDTKHNAQSGRKRGIPSAPRVALATVGCKINQYDTQTMRESLLSAGADLVRFEQEADIYIINSCTVTARADFKTRQLVHRAQRANPQALIVLTGCYASTNPREAKKIAGVGMVIPIAQRERLTELLAPYGLHRTAREMPMVSGLAGRSRGYLKVQEGCDFTCTFCKVRLARGAPKSEPLAKVLAAAQKLIDAGVREIVLTGINLGRYSSNGIDLTGLLTRLLTLPKLGRIRLSSIEPNLVTEPMMDMLAERGRLATHLHLPLQSGSERILQLMGRRYTAQQYADLVENLGARIPEIGIGADCIVGFPGESAADFSATMKLVELLPLSYLHVFSYSHRPGTPAGELSSQVDPAVKKERSGILRELSKEKNRKFRRGLLGKELTVLVESSPGGEAEGLSENYVRVYIPDVVGQNLHNRFLPVKAVGLLESGLSAKALGSDW
jgi:threonylcarbamoyladenosine tRNA methylthiotransferase MtaB